MDGGPWFQPCNIFIHGFEIPVTVLLETFDPAIYARLLYWDSFYVSVTKVLSFQFKLSSITLQTPMQKVTSHLFAQVDC